MLPDPGGKWGRVERVKPSATDWATEAKSISLESTVMQSKANMFYEANAFLPKFSLLESKQ